MTDLSPRPPQRILELKTGHNFRDIGGYPTNDGRTVKWRQVFRSGYMSRISGDDLVALHALGIDTICDFRSNHEREERPTLWHDGTATDLWSRDHQHSVGIIFDLMKRDDFDASDTYRVMLDAYRTIPYEQSGSYREMFHRLADGRLPLVFNCSAGKDRTGVAAGILLDLLGVPRVTVLDDYALSNHAIEGLFQWMESSPTYSRFVQCGRERVLPLLRSEHEYLAETFTVLDAAHGTVGRYLEDVLDITPAQQDAIRTNLLI